MDPTDKVVGPAPEDEREKRIQYHRMIVSN
jgi:hypothetical protein